MDEKAKLVRVDNIDNMASLSCIVKMEGTVNVEFIEETMGLWAYLISMGTTLTAEYIPIKLDVDV